MMKTKTSKRLFSLLLACTMTVSVFAVAVFASAEYAQDSASTGRSNSRAIISNMKMSTSILAPDVTHTVYNTAVVYHWSASTGADMVALSGDGTYYYSMGAHDYSEIAFIYDVGSKYCEPDNYIGKGYYSLTDTYSYDIESLEHEDNDALRYGYDATYKSLGKFWPASAPTYIPTSFDQSGYVWYHNSGFSRTIKATIEYNGEVKNIEVNIPFVGYKTSSVVIGNVTFYLRTGPSRCSIRTDSSNLLSSNFNFVFGDD